MESGILVVNFWGSLRTHLGVWMKGFWLEAEFPSLLRLILLLNKTFAFQKCKHLSVVVASNNFDLVWMGWAWNKESKEEFGQHVWVLGFLVPAMLSCSSHKLPCRMQFLHCDSCPAAWPGPPMVRLKQKSMISTGRRVLYAHLCLPPSGMCKWDFKPVLWHQMDSASPCPEVSLS